MVLRRDRSGVVAVGQASHAWLCGQLARAWGNARFAPVRPLDEVALGAEQHDVGMARWDLDPIRNPDTGLPQSFMEMGADVNAGLWTRGPVRLVTQSRYGALLAIMHGRRLYERHDLAAASPRDAPVIRAFLGHARELESSLLASLRDDPATAPYAAPPVVERNSRLVWIWDQISLALLLDWAPMRLESVPGTGDERVDVALEPVAQETSGSTDAVSVVSLNPWPFAASSVHVHCEGRRLGHGFADDGALAEGLARAPWETVEFALVAGDDSEPAPSTDRAAYDPER
ncbi:MAG: DUF3891 family protein [Solirubrobacteraceae bacterium]